MPFATRDTGGDLARGSNLMEMDIYRVRHHVSDLGWVDFNLDSSNLSLLLLGLRGNWQDWLIKWARW